MQDVNNPFDDEVEEIQQNDNGMTLEPREEKEEAKIEPDPLSEYQPSENADEFVGGDYPPADDNAHLEIVYANKDVRTPLTEETSKHENQSETSPKQDTEIITEEPKQVIQPIITEYLPTQVIEPTLSPINKSQDRQSEVKVYDSEPNHNINEKSSLDLGDEILNMSSASFSLGMSQDLSQNFLEGLDSDFMSNDGSQQNQVQNLLVQEIKSRDKKISTLQTDKSKLKNLLRKAKTAIDDINTKYKAACEKIRGQNSQVQLTEQRFKEAKMQLDNLLKRRQGIDKNQTRQILSRVKVNEIGYTLVQDINMDNEWYRDSSIVNIQDQLNKQWKDVAQVNYNTVFADQRASEEQLVQCMTQYEERLKRVNDYMEQSNSGYMEAQEELKATRLQSGEKQKARDSFILQLIEKSSECKERIMTCTKNASEGQLRNTLAIIEQKSGELLDLKQLYKK